MLVISNSDIQKVFSMMDAIVACQEALTLYTENKCHVPLRLNIPVTKHNGQTLIMPSYIESIDATGIKIVSVYPDNQQLNKPSLLAQLLLLDSETGEITAMIEGASLTKLRTGALQGLATDLLARTDATKGALIGTGAQAAAQLEAMLSVRALTQVKICGRNFDKTQLFVKQMQSVLSTFKTQLIAVKTSEDAIKEADIITTVTTSSVPVFDSQHVKPGTHINAMGGYTPTMQEIPSNMMANADKIYTDTNEGVLSEAGDFIIPLQAGLLTKNNITGELGELIIKKKSGRDSAQQITLFKSVGTAALDTVVGKRIYLKAISASVGHEIIT